MPVARTLVVFVAAMLIASPTPAVAQTAPTVTQIKVQGTPLSISPDGAWLAGTDATGSGFCVWETDELAASCDGHLPEPIEARSIAWTPDSSAVAFSLGASNRLVDSDIYLFDIPSGTLANLTNDDPDGTGADAVSAFAKPVQPVPIDRYPAWSPDGKRLIFARTLWGDENASGVSLMTISRDGGDPEEIGTFVAPAALPIVGPVSWLEDETIFLNVRHPNPQDEMNGLWTMRPGGEPVQVLAGAFGSVVPQPVIAGISPDGRSASVYSQEKRYESLGRVRTGIYFHVDLQTGTATPWEAYSTIALPPDAMILAPPVFGPDGESIAMLVRTGVGDIRLWILDAHGESYSMAEVRYGEGRRPANGVSALDPAIFWSGNGTIMIVLNTGASLVSIPNDSATPGATPTR